MVGHDGSGRDLALSFVVTGAILTLTRRPVGQSHAGLGEDAVILGLAMVMFGAFAVYEGYRAYRPLHALFTGIGTQRVEPHDVGPGTAWVSGTVEWKDHTIEGPLTGTECVAFVVNGERLESTRRRRYWEDFTGMTAVAPFYVDGDIGRLLVEPTGMGARAVTTGRGVDEVGTTATEMVLDWDDGNYRAADDIFDLDHYTEIYVDRGEALPGIVERAIDAHAELRYPSTIENWTVRFREWILEPGDPVHVLGEVRDEPGTPPTITDAGLFVVSDTSPRITFLKQTAMAIRHLGLMCFGLLPFVFALNEVFPFTTAGSTITLGLISAAILLYGAGVLGRFLAFPLGEYRRRQLTRLGTAGIVGFGFSMLGVFGAGWLGFRPQGGTRAPGVLSSFVTGVVHAVPIAVLLGTATYAALVLLGWPDNSVQEAKSPDGP